MAKKIKFIESNVRELKLGQNWIMQQDNNVCPDLNQIK